MRQANGKLPATLIAITTCACIFAISPRVNAQSEIHSTDLSKDWQAIVENMSAAKAADQQAFEKAKDLATVAEAAKARANDTNLAPQVRFESHAEYLEYETKAAKAELDATKGNIKFLSAASAALRSVRKDLQVGSNQFDVGAESLRDQHTTDTDLKMLKYSAGEGVDAEVAEELKEARGFYQQIANGSAAGTDSAALCERLARRLSGWQARNRRHLIMADSALRCLELSAVSGLAGVINFGLNQEATNLTALAFTVDLAPEISGNASQNISPVGDGKVPLSDVLGDR